MKTLNQGRYALSICTAAIMFAGCGNNGTISQGNLQGISPRFLPLTQQPIYVRKPGAFSGETFVGKRIHAVCHFFTFTLEAVIDFRIKGEAHGPFPGTFTARGNAFTGLCCTGFKEHFEVTSGSQKISGVVRKFVALGPLDCGEPGFQVEALYKLKGQSGSGQTSVTLGPRQFTQTFH